MSKPDEEEFDKAKKISKLRVIGAGATSNVIFAFALGAILLTNPVFAVILPEPLQSTFYEKPGGVMVISVMENTGAERSGMMANDVIVSINDRQIFSAIDFPSLSPGDTADVTVLRDGQEIEFSIEITPAPDDPERGLIGITRDGAFAYKPVLNYIEWNDPNVSLFLLWLWMISFFIGIINMLPLPILDGGKFIHTIIDKRASEGTVNVIMWGIYVFTLILFGLNIALSYIKSGWFTI